MGIPGLELVSSCVGGVEFIVRFCGGRFAWADLAQVRLLTFPGIPWNLLRCNIIKCLGDLQSFLKDTRGNAVMTLAWLQVAANVRRATFTTVST